MTTHDPYENCSGEQVRTCNECHGPLCNCFVAYGHDCDPDQAAAELREYVAEIEFLEATDPNHPLVQYLPQARADLLRIQELLNSSEPNTEGNTAMETQENTNTVDPNNITTEDGTISVTEAAALLGVTGQTIRNWVRAGRLTKVQRGNTFRINAQELDGLQSATREIRVTNTDEQRG